MTIFETLFMAVLQGLTEFLPVSSSGHLVLAGALFPDTATDSLAFVLMLHLATACAALVFYRREVGLIVGSLVPHSHLAAAERERGRRIVFLVLVASIPTALIGLTLGSALEELFYLPERVAFSLAVTGVILFAASRRPESGERLQDLRWWEAILVGLAQGAAIVPGISRSGSTIAASLFLGVRRTEAVEFSFLLLIPSTVGAALYEARRLASLGSGDLLQSIIGFFVAAVVGYASIYLVLRWTREGHLWYFAVYCWLAAAAAFAAGRIG